MKKVNSITAIPKKKIKNEKPKEEEEENEQQSEEEEEEIEEISEKKKNARKFFRNEDEEASGFLKFEEEEEEESEQQNQQQKEEESEESQPQQPKKKKKKKQSEKKLEERFEKELQDFEAAMEAARIKSTFGNPFITAAAAAAASSASSSSSSSTTKQQQNNIQVQMISRSTKDVVGSRAGDTMRYKKNTNPAAHPMKEQREFSRAVRAVKLDKILAKPFVLSMDQHHDAASALAMHPRALTTMVSGACDGEIIVWDVAEGKPLWTIDHAHNGLVSGIVVNAEGDAFFSCSVDSVIKKWRLDTDSIGGGGQEQAQVPITEYTTGAGVFLSLDHHYSNTSFATGGQALCVWNEDRSKPLHTYNWGIDTIHHVRFNKTETDIVSALSKDRSITLFDIRVGNALRNVVMKMRPNALAWNPYRTQTFVVASDDFNLYEYDMRNLSAVLHTFSGHVGPVVDVDFAPTGNEFVSGSWDRTLRIYPTNKAAPQEEGRAFGYARDIYHTKRMQRVGQVKFSLDAKYVLSASSDQNIRLWKARAAKPIRIVTGREKKQINYYDSLKSKYAHVDQVRTIANKKHVPMSVQKRTYILGHIRDAQVRKEQVLEKHSKKFQKQSVFAKPIIKERK